MEAQEAYRGRVQTLKEALLRFLGTNGRYYGELTRLEQSVEDLAQALNTRLDQLVLAMADGCAEGPQAEDDPRDRLANRLIETASRLATQGGRVDADTADQFAQTLDLLDQASSLRRRADDAEDAAETAAIKHKRRPR